MGPKNETWFNNIQTFWVQWKTVFYCACASVGVCTCGVRGSLPCSEMEKAKGTLVECLLLEVSNSGY